MKAWAVVLLVVVALGAGGGAGYWLGYRTGASKKDEAKAEDKPVASVAVAVIRRGTIPRQITLYGNVVAPPSEVQVVSVPFEARVGKMLIAPGEVVSAGQPLIEVEASAATTLAFQEAQNAANAAQRDVQLVRQRFEQKLATNQELYAAETALQLAQGRLRSLQQGGAGGPRQLRAEAPGIVSKVDVQRGQVVTAGSPLVEVVGQDRIEVKLAAEAEDLPKLKIEQGVSLTPVENSAAAPVEGKIRLIGQRVDPMTRLVDVLVSLPPDAKLLLDAPVAGKITTSESGEGLIVPRSAVEPGEKGDEYTIFTVKDEKAVKHSVKVAAEGDQDVLVAAEDLKEGDAVVIEGNHELEDGMAVKTEAAATTEPAETQPAASAPATTEASP